MRAHHERWDGSGHPDGLKREAIPIGARILAAVDCLDALTSDRQYRHALSLEDAIAQEVVEILGSHYREMDNKVQRTPLTKQKLQARMRLANGQAPARGGSVGDGPATDNRDPLPFLDSIAAARQEVQALFETTQDIGNSLSVSETLSVVGVPLKRIVPYDCIAIYVTKDNVLAPEYVNGDDFRLFSSLSIPLGDGVSGCVANSNKPVVNGSPSLETAYLNDASKTTMFQSALSAPLARRKRSGGSADSLSLREGRVFKR